MLCPLVGRKPFGSPQPALMLRLSPLRLVLGASNFACYLLSVCEVAISQRLMAQRYVKYLD